MATFDELLAKLDAELTLVNTQDQDRAPDDRILERSKAHIRRYNPGFRFDVAAPPADDDVVYLPPVRDPGPVDNDAPEDAVDAPAPVVDDPDLLDLPEDDLGYLYGLDLDDAARAVDEDVPQDDAQVDANIPPPGNVLDGARASADVPQQGVGFDIPPPPLVGPVDQSVVQQEENVRGEDADFADGVFADDNNGGSLADGPRGFFGRLVDRVRGVPANDGNAQANAPEQARAAAAGPSADVSRMVPVLPAPGSDPSAPVQMVPLAGQRFDYSRPSRPQRSDDFVNSSDGRDFFGFSVGMNALAPSHAASLAETTVHTLLNVVGTSLLNRSTRRSQA